MPDGAIQVALFLGQRFDREEMESRGCLCRVLAFVSPPVLRHFSSLPNHKHAKAAVTFPSLSVLLVSNMIYQSQLIVLLPGKNQDLTM
jgi:hypothetical protein